MQAIVSSKNSTTGRAARPIKVSSFVRFSMQALSQLSSCVAGRVAHELFFHPLQTRPKREQAAILATGTPFTVRARKLQAHGRVFGSGPTVLLVHGWGGNSGQMTGFIAPLVSAGYRVAVLDMPGHGRSRGRLTSVVHFAAAIQDAATALGPFHAVIAHSFGAAGTTMALNDGLATRRVVYVAAPSRFDNFFQRFKDGVGVSDSAFAYMVSFAERRLRTDFAMIQPERIAAQMWIPALIVHDLNDREIAYSEGEAMARAWKGAELHQTTGLGHSRILHDEQTIDKIVSFVTGR